MTINRVDPYIENRLSELVPNENGCLLYPVTKPGYGRAYTGLSGQVNLHKYSLERKLGRLLLQGMQALHTCDVKNCVAEDHLYEGTPKQNTKDMIDRGRYVPPGPPPRGAKHYNTNLDDKKVIAIRKLFDLGYSPTQITSVFKINSTKIVSRITQRKTWKHL